MLKLNNIDFNYGNTEVLNNFSINVKRGERVAIKGPSGCGKSTVLRIIAGLEKVKKGQVIFNGNDITNVPSFKRNFGFVFQEFALFPFLKVKDNIKFGISHLKKKEIEILISEYSRMLNLEDLLNRYPHELSGGQKQRVALARTLVTKPEILLLDEPFSALDQDLKEGVRIYLLEVLKELKITTIIVTHDSEDANVLCNRTISF